MTMVQAKFKHPNSSGTRGGDFHRFRWILLLSLLLWVMPLGEVWAVQPSHLYYQAENCRSELQKSPKKQRYRENWMECINKFQDVYRSDPEGPWAAAGLYMTGVTYLDLHHWSGRKTDFAEAEDLFQRILLRFPNSAYRKKAEDRLRKMRGKPKTAVRPQKKSAASKAAETDAEQWYRRGQECYDKLKTDESRQRYRVSWEKCIRHFEKARRIDPDGPWAAASLYNAAMLYQKLYRWSGRADDKKAAHTHFETIRSDFPQSRYYPKAVAALSGGRSAPATESSPEVLEKAYLQYRTAERCYDELQKNRRKIKYRHHWEKCIRQFAAVQRIDADGPWAAAAGYMVGKLYRGLYRWSSQKRDLRSADEAFRKVIDRFPASDYAEKAKVALGGENVPDIPPAETARVETSPDIESGQEEPPAGEAMYGEAEEQPEKAGPATATGLRFWSNPNYTRIVIDVDAKASYEHHLLKKDPTINKPQRLFVDLQECRLSGDFSKIIPINDDLLINARAGQFDAKTVRVVVDIKSFKTYKIFSLNNPFRIVIDMWGKEAVAAAAKPPPVEIPDTQEKLPPGALARQLALGVRRIVIDPGHGGRDYGAPGYLKGVHEKSVVLQIGKKLAEMVRKELHCEVIMTRSDDRFLTLEERTAIANTKNADLFISIHANSHRDRRAYGIETYFLNLATDDESIRVAARENATSTKNISDLQTILNDLMQNAKINESSRLASYVQTSIGDHLKKLGYSRIKNKGVKQAPFYVLLGAQMPAILIETSFISNSRECKRLINPTYQQRICEAIIRGIREYIQETNPTAFRRHSVSEVGG